jgi:hypothetical protein
MRGLARSNSVGFARPRPNKISALHSENMGKRGAEFDRAEVAVQSPLMSSSETATGKIENRRAPLALWRAVSAFLTTLFHLLGAPEELASRHTLTLKQHALILPWFRLARRFPSGLPARGQRFANAASSASTPITPKPGA